MSAEPHTLAVMPLEIPRDRYDRPGIHLPDNPEKLAWYTRVSVLAETIPDNFNLNKWKQRHVALGVAMSEELAQEALSILNLEADEKEAKKRLDALAAKAMDLSGANEPSEYGTRMHELTELFDKSRDFVPELDVPDEAVCRDLLAYKEALVYYRLTPVECELFVVNDELKAAGTLDRLYLTENDELLVGDIKTGQHDATYPLKVATQVAIYANSRRYDPETGRAEKSLAEEGVSLERGLLVHVPAKTGTAQVYELDLTVGYELAKFAVELRKRRNLKPIKPYQAA